MDFQSCCAIVHSHPFDLTDLFHLAEHREGVGSAWDLRQRMVSELVANERYIPLIMHVVLQQHHPKLGRQQLVPLLLQAVRDELAAAAKERASMAADLDSAGIKRSSLEAERASLEVKVAQARQGLLEATVSQASDGGSAAMLQLQDELESSEGAKDVPVGLIHSAKGGTVVEKWLPAGNDYNSTAGGHYNGQIDALIPFAMRGVIWYQGESNVMEDQDADGYVTKKKALIDGWRVTFPHYQKPWPYYRHQDAVVLDQMARCWLSWLRQLLQHQWVLPTC